MDCTNINIVTQTKNKLLYLGLKSVRIDLQYDYLIKARDQQFLPRGIADQIKFCCAIHHPTLQYICQSIMNFAGSRLLDTMIIHYRNWSAQLRSSYYYELEKSRLLLNSAEYLDVMYLISKRMGSEKTKIMKTHTSKLIRDRNIIESCYITLEEISDLTIIEKPKEKKKTARRLRKPRIRNKRRQNLKGIVPSVETIPLEKLQNSVINLSSKVSELSPHQLLLFYLGKSYAPTPALQDYSGLRQDIINFAYSLRWAWYFRIYPTTKAATSEVQLLERKLIPKNDKKHISTSGNHTLELYIEKVTNDILSTQHGRKKHLPDNLPSETRTHLKEMKNWKEVIIRPADKGDKFFIMDREDYIERVNVHLDDSTTYEKVADEFIAVKNVKEAVENWKSKYKEEPGMTDKIKEFVTPNDKCKPGNNYVNPKAHKPSKNYPGRCISTGCASHTNNLSALTAEELKKVQLPYIATDTNDVLRKIEDVNRSKLLDGLGIIHVTFDVEAMFPSINKSLGLEECRKHLEKREDPLFSTDCIVDAIEITLDHNLTKFNNQMYRQTKGTAMGPRNACQYADVSMNKIDIRVNEGDLNEFKPLLWIRFRDDIYIPWHLGLEKLKDFLDWLNQQEPGIKFTMSTPSEMGTEFLDLYIYMKDGKLQTKPYSKPCNEHLYLIPTSCHPTHTLKNIPYSTAHRIYRITSEMAEYTKSKEQYSKFLEERGYSKEVIEDAFKKIETKSRLDLICYGEGHSTNEETVQPKIHPLVTDFNPCYPNIGKILREHINIFDHDLALKEVINPEKIFVTYRGNPTIKDTLVHSKLPKIQEDSEDDPAVATGKCQCCPKKCVLCKHYLVESSTIASFHTSEIFNMQTTVDCKTENVIYIISDKICKINNVGCTVDSLQERFANHKSHIKKNKMTCEVAKHYINLNNSIHLLDKSSCTKYDISLREHIEIQGIEKVDVSEANSTYEKLKILEIRENYWKDKLRTWNIFGGFNSR